MRVFNLPDLGEGLPDAEIVRWLVKQGESVELHQPMVEMETAKAVVEVPSPFSGKISKLCGQPGDIIEVGSVLVEFDGEDNAADENLDVAQAAKTPTPASNNSADEQPGEQPAADQAATVVGAMQVGNKLAVETAGVVVKALARKLKVDLSLVTPTGDNATITQSDVKQAFKQGKLIQKTNAEKGSVNSTVTDQDNPLAFKASPAVRAYAYKQGVALSTCQATGVKGSISKTDVDNAEAHGTTSSNLTTPKPKSIPRSNLQPSDQPQRVRGVRLAMAMGMEQSHAAVVPTSLTEDADITSWSKQDALARYVRAMVYAAKIEPALNCWFDREKSERIIHPQVHLGLAIDSADGLYVPVIHDAEQKNAAQIRARVEELRNKISSKSLKPEDQQGATITLSNFGSIAGRYGTPVVSPPQVAILGTGRYRQELRMNQHGIMQCRILPLSLTFDHRACTGGEAARFLAAVIEDLQKAT